MPFIPHVVDDSPTAGISGLSVALKKGKRDAAARMIVYLTEKVCTELRWPVGTILEVHLGTEQDHGLLRLRANDGAIGGARVVAAGKGKFARIEVSLGHIRGFVDRDEPKVPCTYEQLDGGFVEIVLPPWAEETHPTKPKVSLPPIDRRPLVELKPRPKLGQRMTVTPSFGDPPLNRSALVAGAAGRMKQQQRLQLAEAEARRESDKVAIAERQPAADAKPKKVARAMVRILATMLDGEAHTFEALYKAMGSNAASTQIVRTTISLAKAQLSAAGIVLMSISGVGYQLHADSLEAAKKVVAEAGRLEAEAA